MAALSGSDGSMYLKNRGGGPQASHARTYTVVTVAFGRLPPDPPAFTGRGSGPPAGEDSCAPDRMRPADEPLKRLANRYFFVVHDLISLDHIVGWGPGGAPAPAAARHRLAGIASARSLGLQYSERPASVRTTHPLLP